MIHPSIAVPPWKYQPEGPYEAFHTDSVGAILTVMHAQPDLDSTMADIVRFCLPPTTGHHVAVHDGNLQLVFGFAYIEGRTRFYGVERAFTLLATHYVDQLDVVMWEQDASGALEGLL
jgi:hypothetical protein